MFKVLLQTVLGLTLSFIGLFLIFNFIQTIVDGPLFWLLFVSLPIIASGVMLLLRAGKSDASVLKKVKVKELGSPPDSEGLETTIKKNEKMSNEYAKTNDARNRLKLLEAAANSQK